MAYLFNVNYTDIEGKNHPNAVFAVSYIKNFLEARTMFLNEPFNLLGPRESSTRTAYSQVSFIYWETNMSRIRGEDPFIFSKIMNPGETPTTLFDFVAYGEEYDSLNLEEQSYYFLQNSNLF